MAKAMFSKPKQTKCTSTTNSSVSSYSSSKYATCNSSRTSSNYSNSYSTNSNYCTITLISHTSKVMLKILQARLQQYMNRERPDFQLVLEKAEEPEIKLPTSLGSLKKQESATKVSIALLTMPKPLTVWITPKCGKF